MQKIRVLLVDDHAVVRAGLHALLETASDIVVVGEGANGREAISLARRYKPDVVLMDLAMPHLNGYEATHQILKANSTARVLVLSSFSSDENILQMLEAGAAGYIVKQSAAGQLLNAIREVAQGKRFFSPTISRRVARLAGHSGQTTGGLSLLSSREKEVVQLVAEGCSNKMIAAEIGISIKTVEKHRQQAMDKLEIHDTAGLTRYALVSGMVDRTGSTDAGATDAL